MPVVKVGVGNAHGRGQIDRMYGAIANDAIGSGFAGKKTTKIAVCNVGGSVLLRWCLAVAS